MDDGSGGDPDSDGVPDSPDGGSGDGSMDDGSGDDGSRDDGGDMAEGDPDGDGF